MKETCCWLSTTNRFSKTPNSASAIGEATANVAKKIAIVLMVAVKRILTEARGNWGCNLVVSN